MLTRSQRPTHVYFSENFYDLDDWRVELTTVGASQADELIREFMRAYVAHYDQADSIREFLSDGETGYSFGFHKSLTPIDVRALPQDAWQEGYACLDAASGKYNVYFC